MPINLKYTAICIQNDIYKPHGNHKINLQKLQRIKRKKLKTLVIKMLKELQSRLVELSEKEFKNSKK